MSNWKTVRLGDICVLNYGKSLTATNRKAGAIPVYSSAGITGWHNAPLINGEGIIIGRKGTVGSVYHSKEPFYCIDTAYYVLPDKAYDFKYLYYRLKSLGLEKLNEDSAVPGLNRETAYSQEFMLPSLEEQGRIAGILGALDDKIECNNRINRNLEEQAAVLFRRWFVDFEFPDPDPTSPTYGKPYRSAGGKMQDSPLGSIPKGWQLKPLGEVCNVITKGTTPTTLKKSFVDSGINFLKAESISDGHFIDKNKIAFIDAETNELLKRSIIQPQDILFTIAGTIGRFCMIVNGDAPANTNQAVAIIRVNEEIISPYVIYSFFIGGWHTEFYESKVQQAVQANLSLTSIRELPILLPDINSLNLYQGLIYPMFKSTEKNNKENQTLATLRDTLLPKLMNNEIKR